MGSHNVKLLPLAYDDLDEILDYLMANSSDTAGTIFDAIMLALRRLEEFPLSGSPVLDRSLRKFDFRMVVIDPYIAFYRLVDDDVLVYRVLHGARNFPLLLRNTIR